MFTSPKACHSACVSAALAQLTKSISLRVCERVMRSVAACVKREADVYVCAGERVVPKARRPLSLTSIIEASGHTESPEEGGVTGQETSALKGFQGQQCPSPYTDMFT